MKKDLVVVGLLLVSIFGVHGVELNASITPTSNDNISYSFNVPDYHGNGQENDSRYRQTTNINNQWKVDQTKTSEGSGSTANKTTYWLENGSETNVSRSVTISSLDSAYYSPAYSSASKTEVYLTAENNNYNGDNFNVYGYWDEETA